MRSFASIRTVFRDSDSAGLVGQRIGDVEMTVNMISKSSPAPPKLSKLIGRRSFLGIGGVAAVAAALPTTTSAYPDRPVRLIVPFSPGGATDVVSRLWADQMKHLLGTVVIENKGGGGGVIGAAEAARSRPDGHTLLFGNTSTQVLIPAIMDHPLYHPTKDFAGIYMVCLAPTCIVVHKSVPAQTLSDLIAYAKANPTKLSYGSAGTGTITNLAGELFKLLIKVPEITHVPYKGSAPGVVDLASGQIPMMTPNVGGPLLEFHRAGAARILAVASQARITAAPDIPTAIEAGLPGMVAANFNGLFAPAAVSRPTIDLLARVTRAALANLDVQNSLIQSGFEPLFDSGPEATEQMVAEEFARWASIVKTAGFKLP